MQVVTRPLGWSYTVDPWTGRAFTPVSSAMFDRGVLVRGWEPARQLPWNPQSYPGVGREPGQFPYGGLPADVPAVPAVPRHTRKAQLGRLGA